MAKETQITKKDIKEIVQGVVVAALKEQDKRFDKKLKVQALDTNLKLINVNTSIIRVLSKVEENNDKITDLQGKVSKLDSRVGGLEDKVEGLDKRVGGLDSRMGHLENMVEGIQGDVEKIKVATLENRDDIIEMKKEMVTRKEFNGLQHRVGVLELKKV